MRRRRRRWPGAGTSATTVDALGIGVERVPRSGGELQRVAIVRALGKPADIYLIDEPSAYLDVEQRIVTARVIKR